MKVQAVPTFASLGEKFAGHPALLDNGVAMSYGELEARGNAIAGFLIDEYAVASGDCIGLCISRGLALPQAILAVLKASAVYVPLDPSFPHTRLHYMADNSRCKITLGDAKYQGIFEQTNTQFIDIEALIDEVSATVSTLEPNVKLPITADDSGYVIYTSGSTGHPKGVELPSKALANLIDWHSEQDAFNQPGKTLQFTPVSFDVHFQEFFVTWMAGGTVVMINDDLRRDPLSLLRFIVEQEITHLYLPFVALQQLAEIAVTYGPIPTKLKQVVTAGEQLQVNRFIVSFFERLAGAQLHNHYGPSESHVVTTHTLMNDPNVWPLLPPIGRPINNVDIVLVDELGVQVPEGQEGEISIAGDCLAKGYKCRAELTAEKFRRLNINGVTNRYYLTGDLARQLPDHTFEYLGRKDSQVKIRGYRVELGEVESALKEHAGVSEVAVAALKNHRQEQSLIAYVVPAVEPINDSAASSSESHQLSQWQQVWDGTYTDPVMGDPKLDFCGWHSSYTGEPLPTSEMTAWVRATIDRILLHSPRRVLEVGCGTGLILHNLAPFCDFYVGTDFSDVALKRLQSTLRQRKDLLGQVRLQQCAAHELQQFTDDDFDCIVLNSVTQHFPSANYLFNVIKDCCALLPSGGTVFLGDVTNKLTREQFFTSLAVNDAKPTDTLDDIRAETQKKLGAETDLVIAPAFFLQLEKLINSVRNVSVSLKQGDYRNELGDYRFDVTIDVSAASVDSTLRKPINNWISYGDDKQLLNSQMIKQRLQAEPNEILAVADIPNRRLQLHCQTLSYIEENRSATKRMLLQAMSKLIASEDRFSSVSIEPNELFKLGSECDFQVALNWHENAVTFDACFIPNALSAAEYSVKRMLAFEKPLTDFTSLPTGSYASDMVPQLRDYLLAKMPDYMVPSKFMLLSQLPLTPTGKLDRRSLPKPTRTRPKQASEYIEPETDMQKALAGIWADILDIEKIGMMDNFFELGGNSLSSLRVALKVYEETGRELPIAYFFQHPTLKSLATFLTTDNFEAVNTMQRSTAARAAKARAAFAKGRRVIRK